MFKKIVAVLTLILFCHYVLNCASTRATLQKARSESPTFVRLQAKELPEIRMTTSGGTVHEGKILSLILSDEGDRIFLLPAPYWHVDSLEIAVEDIGFIALEHKKAHIANYFVRPAASVFILIGFIGIITSEYNEDFQCALGVASLLGLVTGVLGLLIGAASKPATSLPFAELSDEKKSMKLMKIMGY